MVMSAACGNLCGWMRDSVWIDVGSVDKGFLV
jgi:hypothetical protein